MPGSWKGLFYLKEGKKCSHMVKQDLCQTAQILHITSGELWKWLRYKILPRNAQGVRQLL